MIPASPIATAIASLSSDELLRFLHRQRWFAEKGTAATEARVASYVVLPWGEGAFAIARVIVVAGTAEHEYQVPLASRTKSDVVDQAMIATQSNVPLYDAMYDPEFRAGLVGAVVHGATVRGDAVQWVAEPVGAPMIDAAKTTLVAAEQSNTSIIIGDAAILKLFRRIEPGVHPDVEVTSFLTTRANFSHTPALLGWMHFEEGATRTTSGMMQQFLPRSTDAWAYALERARSYFNGPANREAANEFVVDAKRLGAVTRALHEALSSDDDDPDFAAEPAVPEDLDRWANRAKHAIGESLVLLERQITSSTFPKERVAEAQALVSRRSRLEKWMDETVDELGDDLGMCIRIHGDYHLGQVLRTVSEGGGGGGDFMIIDFEGEPARSLEERREKHSPLRDVASMLRSFAYVAATLAMSVEKTIDAPTRELRTARWERDVRAAYLAGYLGEPEDDSPDILPEEPSSVRQLIALFEAEKVFYELTYELNNRPTWAGIPMRGIAKLLGPR